MSRRVTAVAVVVAAFAVLAAACTPPKGPAPTTWKVKPTSIEVVQQEDWDPGDEPYVIQVGFRSKFGVPGSASASIASQCYTGTVPGTDAAPNGTTVNVPANAADITFPNAQNLDVGDLLLNLAPFELFGTISFVMERDAVFTGSCAFSDAFNQLLVPTLGSALDTLLGSLETPPTQEDLINLIVDNIDNVLSALGSLIAAQLEGLGNPDDVIGTVIQIHLPTGGTLRGLIDFGLALAGLDNGILPVEGLPDSVKFRVGHLLPSTATFDLAQPGVAEYRYTSTVGS